MTQIKFRAKLAEIKARAAAASPGPWERISHPRKLGDVVRRKGDTWGNDIFEIDPNNGVWDCNDPQDGCEEVRAVWVADLEFAAHAREDVPWLLAQLEAAQKVVEAAIDIAGDISKGTGPHGQSMETSNRMARFRKFQIALAEYLAAAQAQEKP